MGILKRLAVMTAAYLAAALVLLMTLATLFGLASLHPDAPGYWTLTVLSPVILIAAPTVGTFLFMLVLVISAGPALVILLLTEIFGWHSAFVYAIPTALLSAAGYWTFWFPPSDRIDQVGMVEAALFSLSGACAGLVYWAIAGRHAGNWRRSERAR